MLLTNIAEIYTTLEKYDLARMSAAEAVEMARNIVYPFGLADALLILARVEFRDGNTSEARTCLSEVYQLLSGSHDLVRICNFLDDVASWTGIREHWRDSATLVAAVECLRTERGTPRMPSDDLLWNRLKDQTAAALTSQEIRVAHARGAAMTEHEAMAYALAVLNASV